METKFKINNIKLLSTWCHNLKHNTDCTICRCNLNNNSIYSKGNTSIIVSGLCGHTFHKECIRPWVVKNNHCPICSVKWAYEP